MDVGTDSHAVGTRDETDLRRFVRARDRGDDAAADEAFTRLLDQVYDIVRAAVRAFGDLTPTQQADAEEEAVYRTWKRLRHTFRGSSMGEFVNATKQLTYFVCCDVHDHTKRERSRYRSIDAELTRYGDDGEVDTTAADGLLSKESERREELRIAQAEHVAFLAELLPRLTPESYKTAIELHLAGVPDEEIARQQGATVNTIQQHRSRGLRKLRKMAAELEDQA